MHRRRRACWRQLLMPRIAVSIGGHGSGRTRSRDARLGVGEDRPPTPVPHRLTEGRLTAPRCSSASLAARPRASLWGGLQGDARPREKRAPRSLRGGRGARDFPRLLHPRLSRSCGRGEGRSERSGGGGAGGWSHGLI